MEHFHGYETFVFKTYGWWCPWLMMIRIVTLVNRIMCFFISLFMFFYTSCILHLLPVFWKLFWKNCLHLFSLDGIIYVANGILGELAVRSVKEHCCWFVVLEETGPLITSELTSERLRL